MSLRSLGWLVLACLSLCGSSSPLDDYVNKNESVYKWSDTGVRIGTAFGGTGHVLNVTSQTWLDVSRAAVQKDGVPGGTAVWTHQVVVIVPKKLVHRNISMAYLTGGCNEHPGVPSKTDEDLLVADTVSSMIGAISIVVFQLPNCHIIYPSDPSKKKRSEDAMIAWAWHEYMETQDAEWLPRLPMVKGAMQAMRAAQDYVNNVANVAEIDGWFVAGASKRGWTAWLVGAATCAACPRIVGIAPLVPIAPSINKDMHRQYQSYGGWTFAFADYTAVNLTRHIDDPSFVSALTIIDPATPTYYSHLSRLPKFVIVSSDDEFMQMDWTDVWGAGGRSGSELGNSGVIGGELHLTIANNAEHSLASGLPEVLSTLACAIKSVAMGHTRAQRPSFTHMVNNATGEITVTVPAGMVHGKVVLRHASTISSKRRDFRWVRLASNKTGEECELPEIALKKPVFGGNCVQPILWIGETLKEASTEALSSSPISGTTYRGMPPVAKGGKWVGYYVEVYFPSDTGLKSEFQLTTPGYVWPNTLPFEDCHGADCEGHLV